jgi:hypothetical protein
MNPIPKAIIIQPQGPGDLADRLIPAQIYGGAPEGVRDPAARTSLLSPDLESFAEGVKGGL